MDVGNALPFDVVVRNGGGGCLFAASYALFSRGEQGGMCVRFPSFSPIFLPAAIPSIQCPACEVRCESGRRGNAHQPPKQSFFLEPPHSTANISPLFVRKSEHLDNSPMSSFLPLHFSGHEFDAHKKKNCVQGMLLTVDPTTESADTDTTASPTGVWLLDTSVEVTNGVTFEIKGTLVGGDCDEVRFLFLFIFAADESDRNKRKAHLLVMAFVSVPCLPVVKGFSSSAGSFFFASSVF